MPHVRSDAADEIERRLGDRERIAGVETNAKAASRLAESGELVAAEVLMILNRQDPAFIRGARAAVGELSANVSDQLFPLVAERVTIPAQDCRQAMTNDFGVKNAGLAQSAL